MYCALFLFLIFYDFLETYVPLMNYWDELAALLVLCWGGYSLLRRPRMDKEERISWICLLLLVAVGALGNILHPGLQTNLSAVFRDVVALCKFPAIVLVLRRRSISGEQQEQIIAAAAKISRWIVVVTLFAGLIGWFADLGFYTEEVRMMPGFRFVFSHPTFFVSAYVMIAAALVAESIRKNRVFLLLDCLLLFMAQRTKAYLLIAFLLVLLVLGEGRTTKLVTFFLGSEKEKMKPARLLPAAVIVGLALLVIAKPRVEYYLSVGFTEARTVLPVVGFWIAKDFFPLGSGFGTFASHLSGRYYSNIYEMYGVSNVYGMTKAEYNFISDVFWPYIYGQFGVFGLLIYGKLLLDLFFRQYRSKLTDASRLAMMTVWAYGLIASTSEAYFTNGTGVQMALFLTLFLGFGQGKRCSEA